MIISFEGVQGLGMSLSSSAFALRDFLRDKKAVTGYRFLLGGGYVKLSREELLREVELGNEKVR